MTRSFRSVLAAALASAAVLLGAASASAHVLLDSAQPNGDGTVTLTFSFDHGCTESPTNSLTLEVPAGSSILSVSQPDGWKGSAKGRTVSWTGPGIPPDDQAKFTLEARLAGEVGQPLLFPTKQGCENGEGYDWVDISESSERPSPRLIATAAVLDPSLSATSTAAEGQGATAREILVAATIFTILTAVASKFALRRRESFR